MIKPFRIVAFSLAVLLAGFAGFAAASQALPPAKSALVQMDVDLTEPAGGRVTEKTRETEPEELPSPGDIEVEIVNREREQGAPLRVLIYHTHTYEAYEPDYEGQYKPTERWRTADPAYNVVRVGAELARLLREEYGMTVVHDDTAFEPPRLESAYQRSLEALENYTARGETFDLYLDLHRDAYVSGSFLENSVEVSGQGVARVMFLVGTATGTFQGQDFAQKPDWEINYARARAITQRLGEIAPGVARPVSTKSSRYNQHISTGAFLIEVGNNYNTLAEALAAVPFLARAIGETAEGFTRDIPYVVEGE